MTADTTTLAPTDAEIDTLWQESGYQLPPEFARAVLAKWSAPAPVNGEPSFYTVFASHNGGPIPLPGYSNETEHGVKNLVLEAARREGYKGTAAGRLLELGWWIGPVYESPPPAQEARVPLSRERLEFVSGEYADTEDDGPAFRDGWRAAESHHGITAAQKETP